MIFEFKILFMQSLSTFYFLPIAIKPGCNLDIAYPAFDAFSIYERFVCISMNLKLFSPPTGITLAQASLVVERPQYPPCAVPKGWEDKLIVAPTPRNNFIRHSETAVVRLVSCHFNYRIKHCLPDILSNFLSV